MKSSFCFFAFFFILLLISVKIKKKNPGRRKFPRWKIKQGPKRKRRERKDKRRKIHNTHICLLYALIYSIANILVELRLLLVVFFSSFFFLFFFYFIFLLPLYLPPFLFDKSGYWVLNSIQIFKIYINCFWFGSFYHSWSFLL